MFFFGPFNNSADKGRVQNEELTSSRMDFVVTLQPKAFAAVSLPDICGANWHERRRCSPDVVDRTNEGELSAH
ncbi:unnamed protein product [Vitrella brassicaformis CCMP3155]|uniref:Uncharacterized protein n=1 Tax=Vitrella brassicaformis (strain CCMP3155) TaxID=1169540 RepID=A0A0G4ERX0_VITBC|nr:unnamed protein product [Vitrella brassicaformis CCMP3155]|eukprot:CEM00804.1 unnamed protein product [Vitrella brassicaformis CCMP3155]